MGPRAPGAAPGRRGALRPARSRRRSRSRVSGSPTTPGPPRGSRGPPPDARRRRRPMRDADRRPADSPARRHGRRRSSAHCWSTATAAPTSSLPQAPTGVTDRAPGTRRRDRPRDAARRGLPPRQRRAARRPPAPASSSTAPGHILTNNHVVAARRRRGDITVTFSGGEHRTRPTLVGRDSGYDLAVVKVTGVSGLKPLPLGNSAIGAGRRPGRRHRRPLRPAGHGHLGHHQRQGPADHRGRRDRRRQRPSLRGRPPDRRPDQPRQLRRPAGGRPGTRSSASTARSAPPTRGGGGGQARRSIGLGFAIPVNQAKRVAEELINTGKATHPVIGVTVDMTLRRRRRRVADKGTGRRPRRDPRRTGRPAGLKPGDVITEVDGEPVHSGEELIVRIRSAPARATTSGWWCGAVTGTVDADLALGQLDGRLRRGSGTARPHTVRRVPGPNVARRTLPRCPNGPGTVVLPDVPEELQRCSST